MQQTASGAATAQTQKVLDQIDLAIAACNRGRMASGTVADGQEAISLAISVVDRLTAADSGYRTQTYAIASTTQLMSITCQTSMDRLIGVLTALRKEYQLGYVSTFGELVRSELFTDFLEQAEHLLDEGYKDPAAVICGGILEQHMKKLCVKNNIPLEAVKKPGQDPKELKLEELNVELAKAGVYNTAFQKSITAQIAIRNHAAHGEWNEYKSEQVRSMFDCVLNFLGTCPA